MTTTNTLPAARKVSGGFRHYCPHTGCAKTFTAPTPTRAAAALRMHEGRAHLKSINPSLGSPTDNNRLGNHESLRFRLPKADAERITAFLRARRQDYANNTECFRAALAENNIKLKVSSTNVSRYFKKVGKVKRPYTRRAVLAAVAAPAVPECAITGPGLRIEFSSALLPTILHTIALALGGKKG